MAVRRVPEREPKQAQKAERKPESASDAGSEVVQEETKPSKPTRHRRGDEARGRILDAALRSFGAFGFEGTSTRAIAQNLGIGHTLVIYHFKTKDELWIATVERLIGTYASSLEAIFTESDSRAAKDVLAQFVDIFVRISAKYPEMHRIMTMQSNQGSDRIYWVISHFLRAHFKKICDLIRKGQREGSIRDADPARLYYLIMSAGGTPFSVATEYRELTGRDVFGEPEILRNIAFIHELILR